MEISERLKIALEDKQIKPAELSEITGISKSSIRKKGTKYRYVIPVKEKLTWKQITKSGYVKEKDARNAGNERIKELLEDGLPKTGGVTFREVARLIEDIKEQLK